MSLLTAIQAVFVSSLTCIISTILHSTSALQTITRGDPYVIAWGILCRCKQYLQPCMKRHPVVVAVVVQCVGQITVIFTMVAITFYFEPGIMQHRVFLAQFLAWCVASVYLYVPMPVFVMLVCPLYGGTWLTFHYAVDHLDLLSLMLGAAISAIIISVRCHLAAVLLREHEAVCALQREQNASQDMQANFQAALSSIFDASCTCNGSGQIKDVSPHLQDLLGLQTPALDCEASLVSFAATDVEAERLRLFFSSAASGLLPPTFKIQCSLRRQGTWSGHILESFMTAISLRGFTDHTHGADLLFVFLEVQPHNGILRNRVQGDASAHATAPAVLMNPLDMQHEQRQDASAGLMSSAAFASPLNLLHQHTCDQPSQWRSFVEIETSPEEMRSADGSILGDSLCFSLSAPSGNQRLPSMCNAETQTSGTTADLGTSSQMAWTTSSADVGVQTNRIAAKPPLSDAAVIERLCRTKFQSRPRKRKAYTKPLLSAFQPTPRHVIKELIYMNVMELINPKWFCSCCLAHSLLLYLKTEIEGLIGSEPCRSWNTISKIQCADCFCLNSPEEEDIKDGFADEFCCEFCNGSRIYDKADAYESSPSSVSADDEVGLD